MNNRIALKRKEKKLSQEKLAKRAGITREYLSNVETGNNIPTLTVANNIAIALDSSIDDIFFDKNVVQSLQKDSLTTS